jgi:hypothetical protein
MMMPRREAIPVRIKVRRYWPDEDPAEIIAILNQYGGSGEPGRTRVQLAILKLAEGQKERLPELVQMAKRDYRDVLAYAEYPEQIKTDVADLMAMSKEERKALRQRDKEQYRKWLKS